MTWVKLPDDALDDPAVTDVPAETIVAYLRALGWSNRWARDGRIPKTRAGSDAERWADSGLAEVHADHVLLVWLLEHQPKADEIKESKRLAAERQERHRRHMAGDHSKCDPKRCHVLVTRDKTRDKRPLRPDSDPSLPEGRGEERADDDNGLGGPVVALAAMRKCVVCNRDFLGEGYGKGGMAVCSWRCRDGDFEREMAS